MSKIIYLCIRFASGIFLLAILLLCLSPFSTFAAKPTNPFPGVTAYIGDEVYGVAGPAPVNCVDPAYDNARPALDAQRATWATAAINAIPNSTLLGSMIAGPSGTSVNAPLVLVQPDGFSMTVTPIDLAPAQAFNKGTSATGTSSFVNVQINGSPNGCTMQDNAPRPSAAAGGDFYFNQLNNLRGLNGVHFTFSTPVQAFGAFFGDLETSARGTLAFMRLLDSAGNLIADIPISSTLGLNGGVAAENAQCSLSNVPNVDVAALGLLPGCGNASTRWIGFVSTMPVAQALVVVGDNDALPGGRGLTERLSFMGPAVVRALPPAEVTIMKQAPTSVTTGMPFNYILTVKNISGAIAAGVTITDDAPTGIIFNAISGPGCTLANNQVICQIDTLAAGESVTRLLQATAQVTGLITNSAIVAATNDSNATNNLATATITSLPAPPRNDCAAMPTISGPALTINEILYRQSASAGNDEWVELYATQFIAGGAQFYLSDNEGGSAEFKRTFTIPAGGIPASTYLIIHRIAGIDDTDARDGILEFYDAGGASTSLKLNDTGDNVTLYQGANSNGPVLDYVAYGSGTAINGPGTGWSLPNATVGANGGQSIAVIHNGFDTGNGDAWALSGSSNTLGPATLGANNNGKTACNVALTKQGPPTGIIGQSFTYTLTVSNTTNVTMTGVIVTDTQPAGVKFNSVTGSGCNLTNGQITCMLGVLNPHAISTVMVNATASGSGTITNTAYTNAISDTVTTDNRATAATTFLRLGSIGDFVYVDSNQNGVQNSGETTPLNGVPVTLTFPDGSLTTTVTVDGLYQFQNLPAGVYTVTVGSAPGYVRTSPATYRINLGAAQIYPQADFGFAYQTVQVALAKQGIANVTLGKRFPYTLTLTNLATTTPALEVVVTDAPPMGIRFDRVNDGRCGLVGSQVTCNVGNLAPSASTVIVITATAQTAGQWRNTALITATNALVEAQASFTTTVTPLVPQADLQLLKTVDKTSVSPGDRITFTLTVTNQGPDTATAVRVSDPLPAGMIYQGDQPQQGSYDAATGIWTVGAVPAGASVTLRLMVKIQ